jgi:isopentenyldiphosphate isomerase
MPMLSTLLLAGSAILLWLGGVDINIGFWLWLGVTLCATWGLFLAYRRLRLQALRRAAAVHGVVEAEAPLSALLGTLERADYVLDQATYLKVRALFLACADTPALLQMIQRIAPEYGKPEFLLCVDAKGQAVTLDTNTLQDFSTLATEKPNFELWFQSSQDGTEGRPVLLVARWLCHLAGFRHRVVHLFLDHPTVPGYTLVQVRGAVKAEAPGKFDLPVAGHVIGVEKVKAALAQEMREELGLTRADVVDLRLLDEYEYADPVDAPLHNREWRSVFSARLQAKALPRIRFADGEVAAIATFSLDELRTLAEAFPERLASGLAYSLGPDHCPDGGHLRVQGNDRLRIRKCEMVPVAPQATDRGGCRAYEQAVLGRELGR